MKGSGWLFCGLVIVAGCGDPDDCDSVTGAGDLCGPAVQGTAQVTGLVRSGGGDPVPDVTVHATCDGIGVHEGRTNGAGRFEITVVHALFDPPEDAASGESFTRTCDVGISAGTTVEDVTVTFFASDQDIVPVEVELVVS